MHIYDDWDKWEICNKYVYFHHHHNYLFSNCIAKENYIPFLGYLIMGCFLMFFNCFIKWGLCIQRNTKNILEDEQALETIFLAMLTFVLGIWYVAAFFISLHFSVELFLEREVRRNATVTEVELKALSFYSIIVLVMRKYYNIESFQQLVFH